MFNDSFIVDIETALKRQSEGALLVDVRSPAEFSDATIPDAVNVPILDDTERTEIGILYKNDGSNVARNRGIELVSPKIPRLIKRIDELRTNNRQPIVVFCWRGGLRSRAMTAFLQLAGYPAFQLRGGHKAFRRHVIDFFELGNWGRMLVFRGLTGVGKTRVLQQLAKQQQPVIDLEQLANHRGSAFGGVGLGQQPSQKQFEALLWKQLQQFPAGKWALTEGESRHIGRVLLPLRFYQSLQIETTLWLETSLENRIQIILEDYNVAQLPEEAFIQPIQSLQRRLGINEVENMLALLRQKDWHELVSELMLKYYDPLYRHTKPDDKICVEIDPFSADLTILLQAVDTVLSA
ncbi:MAG: tRNA 2-selenouridine(34) synthase MnmH [Thermodesulfobacteriota bacterium]|nr:tRNA 2-selenouridine(34) synthase MnmH [Thermodesulfobacteriota bacterium]